MAPRVAVGVSRMANEAAAVLRRFVFDFGLGGSGSGIAGFDSLFGGVRVLANRDQQGL